MAKSYELSKCRCFRTPEMPYATAKPQTTTSTPPDRFRTAVSMLWALAAASGTRPSATCFVATFSRFHTSIWLYSLREAAHGDRFVVEQVKDRGELRDHEQVVDAFGGVQ